MWKTVTFRPSNDQFANATPIEGVVINRTFAYSTRFASKKELRLNQRTCRVSDSAVVLEMQSRRGSRHEDHPGQQFSFIAERT